MLPGAPRTTRGSLSSSNSSISHATDALAGTFPQVQQRQPRIAERSRSQPGAPTCASPLPAHPRVRRRAGSSAQYPRTKTASRALGRVRERMERGENGELVLLSSSSPARDEDKQQSQPLPASSSAAA